MSEQPPRDPGPGPGPMQGSSADPPSRAAATGRAPGESAARSARRRAREELLGEIVEVARRQLATEGASALSLRAVARELGMVSSAIYRYVPSRDDLLTLLIVDAYNALGSAAERAEAKVDRADLAGRFSAVFLAVRRWALRNPHEYALVYGSPVPGYVAPELTVGPATRVAVLLGVIASATVATSSGQAAPTPQHSPARGLDPAVSRAIAPVRAVFPEYVPEEVIVRWLMAWTYLFGAISFELFGHRHPVVAGSMAARDAFFAEEVSRLAELTLVTTR